MSVFRVNLSNFNSGGPKDVGMPVAGATTNRTLYAPGPHLVNRLLKDGEVFTDSNYWKQFSYPNVPLEQAFIQVVTDDGSEYTKDGTATTPRVYNLTLGAASTFTDAPNQAKILADTGGTAIFAQITVSAATQVRLNGNVNATFTLGAGATQVFNAGDLAISLIQFASTPGGTATVIVSVKTPSVS
jgi:hypothetical protein